MEEKENVKVDCNQARGLRALADMVDHICAKADNPQCCTPKSLFVGNESCTEESVVQTVIYRNAEEDDDGNDFSKELPQDCRYSPTPTCPNIDLRSPALNELISRAERHCETMRKLGKESSYRSRKLVEAQKQPAPVRERLPPDSPTDPDIPSTPRMMLERTPDVVLKAPRPGGLMGTPGVVPRQSGIPPGMHPSLFKIMGTPEADPRRLKHFGGKIAPNMCSPFASFSSFAQQDISAIAMVPCGEHGEQEEKELVALSEVVTRLQREVEDSQPKQEVASPASLQRKHTEELCAMAQRVKALQSHILRDQLQRSDKEVEEKSKRVMELEEVQASIMSTKQAHQLEVSRLEEEVSTLRKERGDMETKVSLVLEEAEREKEVMMTTQRDMATQLAEAEMARSLEKQQRETERAEAAQRERMILAKRSSLEEELARVKAEINAMQREKAEVEDDLQSIASSHTRSMFSEYHSISDKTNTIVQREAQLEKARLREMAETERTKARIARDEKKIVEDELNALKRSLDKSEEIVHAKMVRMYNAMETLNREGAKRTQQYEAERAARERERQAFEEEIREHQRFLVDIAQNNMRDVEDTSKLLADVSTELGSESNSEIGQADIDKVNQVRVMIRERLQASLAQKEEDAELVRKAISLVKEKINDTLKEDAEMDNRERASQEQLASAMQAKEQEVEHLCVQLTKIRRRSAALTPSPAPGPPARPTAPENYPDLSSPQPSRP